MRSCSGNVTDYNQFIGELISRSQVGLLDMTYKKKSDDLDRQQSVAETFKFCFSHIGARLLPSKHDTLKQHWLNVGPLSVSLAQY